MSYLRLEKAVMTNLEESLRRELLRTNRSGAYSASTLVDCNTRKYHGLLFVPDGYAKSFAELTAGEKNAISHRGRALAEVKRLIVR